MTALAPTTVYEETKDLPHDNGALGWSGQGEIAATGGSMFISGAVGYADPEPEVAGLLYSTGEPLERIYAPNIGCTFGYYVVPARAWWLTELFEGWRVSAPRTLLASQPRLLTVGMCLVDEPSRVGVRTTDAQRKERRATARLTQQIEALLPDLSEGDVGRLVGVSRVTWRDWLSGTRGARRASRQRLLRLRRILELRQEVDPDSPLSHWLDTPVGANLDTTPARLLAQGRDQLVALLAARLAAPDADGLRLGTAASLDDVIDLDRVDEDFRSRRVVYADEDGDGA